MRRLPAWLPLLLLATTVVAAPIADSLSGVYSSEWSDEFDDHFRKYSKRYFGPHFDWRWFKAQAIAESRLDPSARSPAGARGLMQLLPSTFEEIRDENPEFTDLNTPRWNIAAGIYYDRILFRRWQRLPELDRLFLAFASYNAGYGRVQGAYRRAQQPVESWQEVRPHTPGQTRAYVSRIQQLMATREQPRLRGISRLLWVE
jgi:soluble lytic murein transglycosylase-like protein